MIESMTGFGRAEVAAQGLGRITIEIRSTNHKFLETVLHMPEGFLSLEEKIKKEIESCLSRGRIVCVVTIVAEESHDVIINHRVISKYLLAVKEIKNKHHIKEDASMNTLLRLPGVFTLAERAGAQNKMWPSIKTLVIKATKELVVMRMKEGRALCVVLKATAKKLRSHVAAVKTRQQAVVGERKAAFSSDEEKSSFLKSSDITEELDRLTYHVGNMLDKLCRGGAIGKELDFIAQEMQRETNTIGAKSCDAGISGMVVEMKSLIEKIREQVQNIE